MKRILSLLLISAILTGCGHISDDSPDVAEETTTVSQNAEEIAETTAFTPNGISEYGIYLPNK